MTEPLDVLRESLTHWRKTKHPRFADLAEWSSARALAANEPRPLVGVGKKKADAESWRAVLGSRDPLDLPRLVKAIGGGTSTEAAERITLLAKLNDPRVTTGLLALLAAPPYRARTALGFFRTAAKALEESGDPRVKPALEELAARYRSIIETSVGDDVSALLLRTAKAMEVKADELSPALEKKATDFEAMFEKERSHVERGAVKQKAAKHDDDALLAAIYAAPDDDGPRLVFADALSERGDARGEFIALQLNRARGKATPEQIVREKELSKDAKLRVAWSMPLGRGATCHLARGFPDEVTLEPRVFKNIIGDPAFATVHTVNGLERNLSARQSAELLTHPNAARVHTVNGLSLELLEKLPAPLPWRSVGLQFAPDSTQRSHLAKVRELSLKPWGVAIKPGSLDSFVQLEKLKTGAVEQGTFAALVELKELTTLGWMQDLDWKQEAAGLKKLRKLQIGSAPKPAQVAGLPLETLSIYTGRDVDPDGLIAALPTLKELRVECGENALDPALERLLASQRLKQLSFASVGNFQFSKPWTPEGTLEILTWNRMEFEKHAKHVALVPEGCVAKVLIKPRSADPWVFTHIAPEDAAIAALRAAAKMPVEVAWF